METGDLSQTFQSRQESTSLASKFILVVFCLIAGLGYRFLVGLLPPGPSQLGVLLAFAVVLLLLALGARRSASLNKYWEIPFAFFIFTVAGILGDQGGFIQRAFVMDVLHEAPTAHDSLASTVMGTIWAQLFSTACLVVPIIVLTKVSGNDLKSIFLSGTRKWWPLVVGALGFVLYFLFTLSGRAATLFPNNGVTRGQFLAFTPAIIVLVLCNGLREELWFRGLFLNKYGRFLSPFASNALSAIIFASFHVQVHYTPALIPFLIFALVLGLLFGFLMQKSGSLLPSLIFHAGSDIPIFLVYLSYAVR